MTETHSTSGSDSTLTGALTQLEAAERDLSTQHVEATALHASVGSRLTQLGAQLKRTREAIAVLRGNGGASPRRVAPRAPASTSEPERLQSGKQGQVAAAAREDAVMRLILAGTTTTVAIRAAVTAPRGATPQQHRQSIQNALSRMKKKGLIAVAGDGWALTAKGRKAALAAKEAP